LGLSKVAKLSETIEAHYVWMESELGKQKLAQLYQLLDAVIQLETLPPEETLDATADEPAVNFSDTSTHNNGLSIGKG
jgi:hypothetical protein